MPFKAFIIVIIGSLYSFTLIAQGVDSVYTNAERMPYFPGCKAYKVDSKERRQCSNQTVKAYLFNHIIYPQSAKDANIEGAVYVRFIIDEVGTVQAPQLLKDIGGGCGLAALEVIKNMPQWEPAYHKGKNVKVALDLPIHFYFKESESEKAKDYTLVWAQANNALISKKQLCENLDNPIAVFDIDGKTMAVNELHFTLQKGNKILHQASSGHITKVMEKLVKKAKNGNRFSIIATVQKAGQFIEVAKEYEIIK